MHNLADKPEFKELKGVLWTQLEQALKEQKDPRIMGDGDIFDSYEYVGNARHSWENYLNGTWEPQRH
jgi:N-sulfoglucosamine sulfohydrolase